MLWRLPLVVPQQAQSLRNTCKSSQAQAKLPGVGARAQNTNQELHTIMLCMSYYQFQQNPSRHIPILLIPSNELSTAPPKSLACQRLAKPHLPTARETSAKPSGHPSTNLPQYHLPIHRSLQVTLHQRPQRRNDLRYVWQR